MMSENTLLPADIYVVINRSLLTENDKLVLNMLYMPIIGSDAVMLYNSLYNELKVSNFMSSELTHHHLLTNLGTNIRLLKDSRIKLESVGLLKTYVKEGSVNNYIYELYSPLSISEFFNHPIFNNVLYTNVGKDEYTRIKNYFKVPKVDLSEYKDITSKFDMTFKSQNYTNFDIENNDEIASKIKRELSYESYFDFDAFISSFPKNLLNDKALNKSVRELINHLAYLYRVDALTMADIAKVSINEKGLIDKDELRKNIKKYYEFNNNGKTPSLIYKKDVAKISKNENTQSEKKKLIKVFESTSPYDFLKSKYKGAKPTTRDMNILEMLLVDIKLNPSVVNVLIDFTLKTQDNRLVKAFVETLAGEWKRNSIETAEDAMEYAGKQYKKLKKVKEEKTEKKEIKEEKVSKIPSWLSDNVSKKEIAKEEKEELEDFLKEYV